MIFSINNNTNEVEKIKPTILKKYGYDERRFQDILFNKLNDLLPDDELLFFSQSRQGNEEPDLFAIDKDGNLFLFELKIWESSSENILQALRYGQIYGSKKYSDLNYLFKRDRKGEGDLCEYHKNYFELEEELDKDVFNKKVSS